MEEDIQTEDVFASNSRTSLGYVSFQVKLSSYCNYAVIRRVFRNTEPRQKGAFSRKYIEIATRFGVLRSDHERSDQAETFWWKLQPDHANTGILKFHFIYIAGTIDGEPHEPTDEFDSDEKPIIIRPRSNFWILCSCPSMARNLARMEARGYCYLPIRHPAWTHLTEDDLELLCRYLAEAAGTRPSASTIAPFTTSYSSHSTIYARVPIGCAISVFSAFKNENAGLALDKYVGALADIGESLVDENSRSPPDPSLVEIEKLLNTED